MKPVNEKPPDQKENLPASFGEYKKALTEPINRFIHLAMLATRGKVDLIPGFLNKPGGFLQALMTDEKSYVREFLLARSLDEVVERKSEKDPLEWARLARDLQKDEDDKQIKKEKLSIERQSARNPKGRAMAPVEVFPCELISAVDEDGETTESGKRRQ